MSGYVVFVIHNLLSLAMLWHTANCCLTPRFRHKMTLLLEAGSLALCALIARLAELYPVADAIRPFAILAVFISFAVLIFRNGFFRKVFVMLCVFVTVIATEVITYLLFPSFTINVHFREFSVPNVWWYFTYLGCEAILLFFVYLLFHKNASDAVERLPARQYWFFLFFPISQFVLLTGAVFSVAENISLRTSIFVATFSLICFAADLVWFREIRQMSDNARLKAENDLLGKQIEAQQEYYKTLSANYADMATMRHDIANHIFTIRALLLDGKSGKAMQYAAKLEKSHTAQSILSSCKNSVVQSFLQHKLDELRKQEIVSDFDVTLAPVTGISDTDLIIALGNMLDNASEACASVQKRCLRLTVKQVDRCVQIETENTCAASPAPKKRRITYLERGIGTSILRSLAEQYHGSYISACADGMNHAVLVLRGNGIC